MDRAETPVLYGAKYSVYVQAVLLCLEEKRVAYDFQEVDVFAAGGPPLEHSQRHPFGRIPAFQHGEHMFYETAPICRYIDEAFDGTPLQPRTPLARARMGQAISIADNYVYKSMVWGVYVETVDGPANGRPRNDERLAAASKMASTCLLALEQLAPESPWLAGDALTLADLHVAPMIALFRKSPVAACLMSAAPRIEAWFERVSGREASGRILA